MTGWGEGTIRAAAGQLGNPTLRRIKLLRATMHGWGKTVVAFSGGVDSSLLAKVARDELDRDATAVIAVSPTLPRSELQAARETAARIGIRLVEVEHDELAQSEITRNDKDRCYFCKGALAKVLQKVATDRGATHIIDGVNASDLQEYRPGIKAATEAGVAHPLAELNLTKDDVRAMAKLIGLTNWDKPAAACLSSRIPYGTPITRESLSRIEGAEDHLRTLGFRQVRVRTKGTEASIEVEAAEVARAQQLLQQGALLGALQSLGYTDIAVDPKGYRAGSLVPAGLHPSAASAVQAPQAEAAAPLRQG